MLAKKAGLDPNVVFEAIKGGLAGSNVLNAKGPMMIAGNFEPGFRILEERGYIRKAPRSKSPKGGRPSEVYEVNPAASVGVLARFVAGE